MNSGYYLYSVSVTILWWKNDSLNVYYMYMETCFFCSIVHILLLVHFPLLLMWLKMMWYTHNM